MRGRSHFLPIVTRELKDPGTEGGVGRRVWREAGGSVSRGKGGWSETKAGRGSVAEAQTALARGRKRV